MLSRNKCLLCVTFLSCCIVDKKSITKLNSNNHQYPVLCRLLLVIVKMYSRVSGKKICHTDMEYGNTGNSDFTADFEYFIGSFRYL